MKYKTQTFATCGCDVDSFGTWTGLTGMSDNADSFGTSGIIIISAGGKINNASVYFKETAAVYRLLKKLIKNLDCNFYNCYKS